MVKNSQTSLQCEHRMIFKVYLAIFNIIHERVKYASESVFSVTALKQVLLKIIIKQKKTFTGIAILVSSFPIAFFIKDHRFKLIFGRGGTRFRYTFIGATTFSTVGISCRLFVQRVNKLRLIEGVFSFQIDINHLTFTFSKSTIEH